MLFQIQRSRTIVAVRKHLVQTEERLLQPRKYQKYPHRSWLGNWLWALIVKIQGYCYLKCREYLQKLYSLDTSCLTERTNVLRSDTSNRINHTACYIWPTMFHISCALINSSTLKTSSISTNSWVPELFKTLQETSYILLGVHSWFIWYPFDISRAFECTIHMTISSTLKFTNTLPYAWKYHRIDSTERIQKRGFWLAAHNRRAPEFNTLEQRLYK